MTDFKDVFSGPSSSCEEIEASSFDRRRWYICGVGVASIFVSSENDVDSTKEPPPLVEWLPVLYPYPVS